MDDTGRSWETRVAALWQSLDSLGTEAFLAKLEDILAELDPGSPVALFERGAAHDSTGRPDLAVPLYEAALQAGLSGLRRRRAVIQMASSLRNLGHPKRAEALLRTELALPHDELTEAVRAFLALALVDLGREREAVSVSLQALSGYLPRYNRSLARYAEQLRGAPAGTGPFAPLDMAASAPGGTGRRAT